ncbi:hypothetical protein IB633_05370 [Francisella philomiragia]|uniref:Uncharacterized protein n=1 Tax=Francisella philomiragia TaxID=28110 RepID=A0AAW3D9U3_9GAMM|nr:hypothetical protein [Francisella philomiragia]AJI46443.1 hypothetical protein BF30_1639 [Francisella philomiragia]AJI48848.1 hypothetical protein KU46_1933 [Francisella philomiragia]KFJ42271.1 hypothetical protein DR78_297 [Francisella philomiragia]MBK2019672.1 hypothetical protein [Francisella philomiragia]MBK2030502.1 hypothetical protein [Francisella philomiragia]
MKQKKLVYTLLIAYSTYSYSSPTINVEASNKQILQSISKELTNVEIETQSLINKQQTKVDDDSFEMYSNKVVKHGN